MKNKHKKIAFIVIAGATMMFGDYLYAYYDSLPIFFTSEIISLVGWSGFVIAMEK